MLTDDDLIERHQQDLVVAGLRPGTIYQRRRVLARFGLVLNPAGLLDATHRDLAGFLSRPVKPESRAAETTHLRQFYDWCLDEELLEVSPAARLRRPKVPRRVPRPISEEDLEVAIELAPSRLRAMLLLAAFAGLRCCEIAQLRAEDIRWSASPPSILVREAKGGHSAMVALPAVLARGLDRCDLPAQGWLFTYATKDGPLPPHMVSQLGNQYLHSIGLEQTMHTLRHRYGTQMLKASGNIRTTQEALRHASITSTMGYTAVTMDDVAAAAEALPSFEPVTAQPFPVPVEEVASGAG